MVIAGELSGALQAAALVRAVRRRDREVDFAGRPLVENFTLFYLQGNKPEGRVGLPVPVDSNKADIHVLLSFGFNIDPIPHFQSNRRTNIIAWPKNSIERPPVRLIRGILRKNKSINSSGNGSHNRQSGLIITRQINLRSVPGRRYKFSQSYGLVHPLQRCPLGQDGYCLARPVRPAFAAERQRRNVGQFFICQTQVAHGRIIRPGGCVFDIERVQAVGQSLPVRDYRAAQSNGICGMEIGGLICACAGFDGKNRRGRTNRDYAQHNN